MIQVPMTYLGRRGCRIGEYALITVERHKYQSDSSYPIHSFPFLHYVIIMVRVVVAFTNPFLTICVDAKQEA